MSVILFVSAVAALVQRPSQPSPDDIGAALLPPPSHTPRDVHDRFHAQARDSRWADPIEAQVRERYGGSRARSGDLHVRCRTRLCEVSTRRRPGDDVAQNRGMGEMQGAPLAGDLGRLGLVNETQSLFSGDAGTKGVAFLSYWSKTALRIRLDAN